MTQLQSTFRMRAQAAAHPQDLRDFDFSMPAELFPSRHKNGKSQMRYKRFDTAAEAVRYAVEDMTEAALLGAYLQVDEARFGVEEIRSLYDNAAYPLKRAATAQA